MIYFFDNYASLPIEDYKKLLPVERAEKLERFRFLRDKENCLGAYLLLQYALKQIGIENFEIEIGKNNKPQLKNGGTFFNISHCKLGIAVAVGQSEIGIDIQDITPYEKNVAKRVCTAEEINQLESSDSPDRAFTRLWTLKESAVKCNADGIKSLSKFSFANEGNSFIKYGKSFKTFERENLFISVCGSEDFSDIIEIKNLEVF